MAEQRTKELGVRKILDASVTGLVLLMSQEFAKWVLIACFVMTNWLQSIAYRINLTIWIFLSTVGVAFAIANLTVSY